MFPDDVEELIPEAISFLATVYGKPTDAFFTGANVLAHADGAPIRGHSPGRPHGREDLYHINIFGIISHDTRARFSQVLMLVVYVDDNFLVSFGMSQLAMMSLSDAKTMVRQGADSLEPISLVELALHDAGSTLIW